MATATAFQNQQQRHWDRVNSLSKTSQKKLYSFYNENKIFIEVRAILAAWIENHFLYSSYVTTNAEHNEHIRHLCEKYFIEIERAAKDASCPSNGFVLQFKLIDALNTLKLLSTESLYERIKHYLNEELRLIEYENRSQDEHLSISIFKIELMLSSVRHCRDNFISVAEPLKEFKDYLRALAIQPGNTRVFFYENVRRFSERQKVTIPNQDVLSLEAENLSVCVMIRDQETVVLTNAGHLLSHLKDLVDNLDQNFLRYIKWSEITFDSSFSLNTVQTWYREIVSIITRADEIVQLSISNSAIPYIQYELDESLKQQMLSIRKELELRMRSLLTSSMALLKQPEQIICKESSYKSSVVFLCGDEFIAEGQEVKIVVLNESQAAKIYGRNTEDFLKTPCGRVTDVKKKSKGKCSPEPEETSSSSSVHEFNNNVFIPKEEREKTTNGRAMCQKYCLLYYTKLQLGCNFYPVWCCSKPFAYTTNNYSQLSEGWGTIFWDRYFHRLGRLPFVVPEDVPWSEMVVALNKFFKEMTKTDWNFTEANRRCLGERIFGTANFSEDSMISRSKFFEKDNISSLGAWGWVYSYVELVRKHLTGPWGNGDIVGFINRQEAESIILRTEPGTCLIQFSTDCEGEVSIVCVRSDESVQQGPSNQSLKYIESTVPFTSKDLELMSLPERIQSRLPPYRSNLRAAHPIFAQIQANPNTTEATPNRNREVKMILVMIAEGDRLLDLYRPSVLRSMDSEAAWNCLCNTMDCRAMDFTEELH